MATGRMAPFSEAALRDAVAGALCWADVLRSLGYQVKGQNYRTVQRWVERWGISVEHFDSRAARARPTPSRRIPLEEIMVEHSTYSRGKLKARLFAEGLKQPVCEICGQGEVWNGRRMSLILDHINGISDDHRLVNLRIVCPNCNATLETHCGRNIPRERICAGCGQPFVPNSNVHRHCSRECWGRVVSKRARGSSRPETRKVDRPSYEQLQEDVARMSMLAVGRKYGVSDNAVRKWIRWYEARSQTVRDEMAA